MSISWDDLIRDAGDAITSFEPIPDGDYDLEVLELKPEMTKDGSKKKFNLKAKIVGGPHANRFIWDNIVLTTDNPNALGFFFKKMAGLGLTIDFFKTKPSDEQIASTAKNRRFRAKIGSRIWNGEKKNEIKNYYPSAPASNQPPGMTGAVTPPQAAAPPPAPAPAPQMQQAPPPAPEPQPAFAPVAQQDPWTGQPAYQPPPQSQQAPPEQPTSAPPAPAPTPEQPAAASAPPEPQYTPAAPQASQEGGSPAAPPPPPAPPF